ncbi:hypothetical protein D9Q98_008203 [Chlorella vulgaris]|uniref:Uncharacterized protein n=1 Tax=Chlorella vulgaris TaxID=3077 RepID=A0A9D4TG82_CHLVU|nr:hypothetical protein D9Q98_008203 [Chlorella vulgaris]
MSTPARSTGEAARLRADAADFLPQVARKDSPVKPIRTQGPRGSILATLDAIPFTPSQGVCTPSPTNMAGVWVPHPFFHHQQAWGSMGGYTGSPGRSSGASDSSMMHGGSSQPGTPGGGGGGAMFAMGGPVMAPMVWGGFCQQLAYSPTALQIAAASGALGSNPGTPTRRGGGGASPGAICTPYMAAMPGMPGSPMVAGSPCGPAMFAQYFGGMGASSKSHSHSPDSKASSASGDECEGSDALSSAGSGGSMEVSDAAHQIAHAMCAAQQLPGDPPQPLLELASLLHAYGLVSAVQAFPPPPAASPSPDSRRQQARARQKAVPKLNHDGSVRLNARQRRTLRRAQERAMKALLEAQSKAHGITLEQAASNLASIGVASMLLGSPPPGPGPMHSPMQHMQHPGAFMAAHEYPMMPLHGGMVHPAAMAQHHAGAPFDASYSMAMAASGEQPMMHMHMPVHSLVHGSPPPRFAGYGGGGGRQGMHSPGGHSRGTSHRSTPGGQRMSRFAPDAVAAF